jgi:hypothetical protein
VRKLEAATGQPVKAFAVVQTKTPIAGAPAEGMQELKIFRPSVANLTAPKRETPPSMRLDRDNPDLTIPTAKSLDVPSTGAVLSPLDRAPQSPLDSAGPGGLAAPNLGGMPDLGGVRSLPSPGGAVGGVHGVPGR